ncbi:MAG: molybdopterin-dependent oxidoreductase, partial [Clostridium sp.]|nr:molybdopterin-dependent oxidoreductase [Clostridium sp.]
MLKTAAAVVRCIRVSRTDSPFLTAAERLSAVLEWEAGRDGGFAQLSAGGSAFRPGCRVQELPPFTLSDDAFTPAFPEVLRSGPNPPTPVEEERIINTAGLNNCGGCCVIRAVVREGCLLRIETDGPGNSPQLKACVRGRGYRKTFLSGQRLKYPMKRIGRRGSGKFARISWEAAADIA